MSRARREFPAPVRREIQARAKATGILRCEGCGIDLTGKKWEIDHTIAEALVVDKSRKLTAADGKLLGCDCCHRGPDGKTAKDVAAIAEAKRREAIHLGARPAPARKMQGQPFPKTGKTQHREAKARDQLPMPERRPMFARVER